MYTQIYTHKYWLTSAKYGSFLGTHASHTFYSFPSLDELSMYTCMYIHTYIHISCCIFLETHAGHTFYSFPTLDELSKASEEELREMGMGYRAKFIVRE
jgi:hypothetical protein